MGEKMFEGRNKLTDYLQQMAWSMARKEESMLGSFKVVFYKGAVPKFGDKIDRLACFAIFADKWNEAKTGMREYAEEQEKIRKEKRQKYKDARKLKMEES
jgi:hypothetical protein